MRRRLALSKVYGFIEPGPVVLVSTCRRGVPNLMPMSWHRMVEFEPPQIACVLSDRNDSYDTIRATRECVMAIPSVEIAEQVVACGNWSGRDVDKFAAFGLTPLKAATVRAPLVAECHVNLECRLLDGGADPRYGILVREVQQAWLDRSRKNPRTIHHLGTGNFMVAGRRMHVASRMR